MQSLIQIMPKSSFHSREIVLVYMLFKAHSMCPSYIKVWLSAKSAGNGDYYTLIMAAEPRVVLISDNYHPPPPTTSHNLTCYQYTHIKSLFFAVAVFKADDDCY